MSIKFRLPFLALTPAFALEAETVHWLSTDPHCNEDDPSWKQLRHVLTLPDEFFDFESDRLLREKLQSQEGVLDYKRMRAAGEMERNTGLLSLVCTVTSSTVTVITRISISYY